MWRVGWCCRSADMDSEQYMGCYYYTDALLTVLLYVLLISLYSRVFGELRFAKHMRLAAVVLLLGTAGFSYAVVAQSDNTLVHRLWFRIRTLSEPLFRWHCPHLSPLGRGSETTRNAYPPGADGAFPRLVFQRLRRQLRLKECAPQYGVVKYAAGAIGCLLPLAWCITLMRYSEESRLAPAQLVAVPR